MSTSIKSIKAEVLAVFWSIQVYVNTTPQSSQEWTPQQIPLKVGPCKEVHLSLRMGYLEELQGERLIFLKRTWQHDLGLQRHV